MRNDQLPTLFFSGAYVPLTKEGNIMVDGILASCYADFHQDLAHLTMTPLHIFSDKIEWAFGDVSGYPVFVSTVRQLGMLLLVK